MENIDYSWDESNSKESTDEKIDVAKAGKEETAQPKENLSTRHDLQLMRRGFHVLTGGSIATLYLISFSHSQMVNLLGTIACALYVVEQVRVAYPETAAKLLPFTRFIMRAEEQLKESAMVPYAMAVLLTIVAFPKHIALIGIYSLAIADPLSAIIGIKWGKHKISPTRSVEGGIAFFLSVFLVTLIILTGYNGKFDLFVLFISLFMGLAGALFDLIPLKLDDNMTIPLFVSSMLWLICTLFGVYI
jgi:dolichol kinase